MTTTTTPNEKQERAQERRQELRRKLERQVEALTSSDEWRRWLECRAVFHDYSFSNVLLILSQKPDASRVAGFHAWKKVGRSVTKGERALYVWAPMLVKVREEDAEEGGPVRDGKRLIFRPVPVFDVSQTEGDDLPTIEREPITGDSHADYLPKLERFAETIGYSVSYEPAGNMPAGAGGYCSPAEKKIVCRADEPANRTVRTLLHEIAHALGVHYARFPGDDDPERFPRDVAEVMVDSAAFVAAGAIGLDTGPETVPYVAGWANGKVERIRAVAEQVDALARRLESACGIGKADRTQT